MERRINRLRQKLILAFLMATLAPLGAALWMSKLLLEHSLSYRVRTYELDENGHVNNAVYLQWAENLTAEHAERCGFGRGWSLSNRLIWIPTASRKIWFLKKILCILRLATSPTLKRS